MPIIGTMEIVVVAAGLLVLLFVPAVFAFVDERHARAAAVIAPAAAIGVVEAATDQQRFSSQAASDAPDDSTPRGVDSGAEAVVLPPARHGPADT
jgi:hypothetical protein